MERWRAIQAYYVFRQSSSSSWRHSMIISIMDLLVSIFATLLSSSFMMSYVSSSTTERMAEVFGVALAYRLN